MKTSVKEEGFWLKLHYTSHSTNHQTDPLWTTTWIPPLKEWSVTPKIFTHRKISSTCLWKTLFFPIHFPYISSWDYGHTKQIPQELRKSIAGKKKPTKQKIPHHGNWDRKQCSRLMLLYKWEEFTLEEEVTKWDLEELSSECQK